MQGNTPLECEILNVIQGAGIWPDCEDKSQLLQAIESLISAASQNSGTDVGVVSAFAMQTPPQGWLTCDGSAVSRAEYADLFSAIGTVWGVGDGVSTFNVPDLRGEFLRGLDAGRGIDSGRAFATTQADAFESHSHGFSNQLGADHEAGAGYIVAGGTPVTQSLANSVTDTAGGSETRPRNVSVVFAIKA